MIKTEGECDNCGATPESALTDWTATRPLQWPADKPFMICLRCRRGIMRNIARRQSLGGSEP